MSAVTFQDSLVEGSTVNRIRTNRVHNTANDLLNLAATLRTPSEERAAQFYWDNHIEPTEEQIDALAAELDRYSE